MTTPDPFAAPAQGGTLGSLEGKLVLIECLRVEKKKSEYPTDDGTGMKNAIFCNFTVLAGDESYTLYEVPVMSGSMSGQLLPYVGTGTPVLGTLAKEKFKRGPGWILLDSTDADKDIARAYIANKPKAEKPKDPFATAQ